MKRFLILGCAALALAACGARVEPTSVDNADLAGVGGFLKRAFASSSNEIEPVLGGGLCGDPMLVGERVGKVDGPGVCGIENAVSLKSVAGVRLSQNALVECRTAQALRDWVVDSAKPQFAKQGGGLVELKVAAHYACRTRNNQRGAKISEHGKGRAIDISALRLADGSEITVLNSWGGKLGKKLRAMHKAACGPFGTVLGPNADRHHKDHFHFDVAQYRSGSYCR